MDAILNTRPSRVESNWKSTAHTTLGASVSVISVVVVPLRLRALRISTRRYPSRHSR
jgi:hypothetical protein